MFKHQPIVLVAQEIVPVVVPSEPKVVGELVPQFLINRHVIVVFVQEHEELFKFLLLCTAIQYEDFHLLAEFAHEVTEDGDSKQEIEGNDNALMVGKRVQITETDGAERCQLKVRARDHFVRRGYVQQIPIEVVEQVRLVLRTS